MKFLFIFLGIILANAQNQTESKDYKLIVELGIISDNSSKISKPNPAFAFGIRYRYPMEADTRLELGGNLKSGATIYNFDYGKNGSFYKIESKGYILNLGGRLVKEFSINNQKIEWISELTFNTLFVDGTGIPDDPIREPEIENTTQIIIDAESIPTLQFGQGLRIWKGNIGIGIKASITPYGLWYKTTVPNQFNVFSAEATISIKL
ncbi:hypothetical protein [Epilithonimonas tenax]|uniref:hypothetical protein n=1 Tax=Epilithonimonas tenax TaxID=191577 RepID=UPI00042269D0|nr:hypothetical protein [Epilithonimonas tenax]